ncbi:helix-turn-helix transcriptional regulator [Agrobacterium sp. 22-226-1]
MKSAHKLSQICEDISSLVTEASTGLRSWSDLCSTFTDAFPGSYAALLRQNFVRPDVGFVVSDGLEDRHLHSFINHYSYVNPWRRFWQYASNGAILVAQRDDPAARYHGSVFYEEWMKSVGDFDAAVGLRLQVHDEEIIYLPVHFPDKLSSAYELSLETVMLSTRRSLTNALQIASYFASSCRSSIAKATLSCLESRIAFVVDDRMKLIDANKRALTAFGRGSPVVCNQDVVRFAQRSATIAVVSAVRTGARDLALKRLMMVGEEHWVITINQLSPVFTNQLMDVRRHFLVQIHKIGIDLDNFEGDLLAQAYGLTRSEVRLCKALATGAMLVDAAAISHISYENARQKLKSIFKKVGVSSQADLRVLICSAG